ncbi:long-chain fatty acid--CoA ligase [Alicyclobacillus sp.]|uniref:long-chain-fatty-acid--CoA ligase n=1 Tax=Alicyclobacillus sp. TaxID=61169 RepID=UPI0025C6791A|nr:long-chain fatty acid--CoA ligase [Alicyclobacillus sp.]MCL6516322.1 long-chain fatty acid--CoA ligase [Alicyclobacillus sp.]
MTDRPWTKLYTAGIGAELRVAQEAMIDVFEATAHRLPQAPAVLYFDEVITFGELNDRADRLAARLAAWGVGPGDRVGLYLQNDPAFLIAQYAAWKRGAIVVPLNPMFKEKELLYHLTDAGVTVLVALDSLYTEAVHRVAAEAGVKYTVMAGGPAPGADGAGETAGWTGVRAGDGGPAVVRLSEILREEAPHTDVRVLVRPDDVAYLIYTSGTTGQPKGAMNLHRNVAYNARVYQAWMEIGSSDVILGIAPLFHVTGIVGHIALSACTGAPLVLFHRFDPAVALHMLRRWRPTMTVGAITAYIALLNHPDSRREDFSSMRRCYSGGAPIPERVVEQFEEAFGVYIHNIYGLTETNSPSHAVPFGRRAPVDAESGALSIGVPVPGCDAKVVSLDDPHTEVPPGELGELALRGPMVFAGYWNRPEATAQSFCDGYFLTGDVVRRDEDGWFYVVDRKKDVIIASGFKVWPREVEDVLYQHPAVREAAVVGVPDAYRGETVKAFVALKPGFEGTVSPEELVAFCRDRMAVYKYPRQVEILPELPKTATGKFLRRALRG